MRCATDQWESPDFKNCLWTNHTDHTFVFEYVHPHITWDVSSLFPDGKYTSDGVVKQFLAVTRSQACEQSPLEDDEQAHQLKLRPETPKKVACATLVQFDDNPKHINSALFLAWARAVSSTRLYRSTFSMPNNKLEPSAQQAVDSDGLFPFSHGRCSYPSLGGAYL